MRMDHNSLSKVSSAASSARSSGNANGSNGGSRLHESAHFANIMVEFETSGRERAVDVPDSFIGHTKTPPKYPPPPPSVAVAHNHLTNGGRQMNGFGDGSNNSSFSAAPPPREHLRIEEDGHLLNTMEGPNRPPPARGSGVYHPPSLEQSARIQKYSSDLTKQNLDQEKRVRETEFLRQSLRTSQKMHLLKEGNRAAVAAAAAADNHAFEDSAPASMANNPGLKIADTGEITRLLNSVMQLPQPLVQSVAPVLAAVAQSPEFSRSVNLFTLLNRISATPSCVPTSVETQDLSDDVLGVLERLRHDAGSAEERADAEELSELLRDNDVEALCLSHDKVGRLINFYRGGDHGDGGPVQVEGTSSSGLQEEALLERLSHYSEPNIKVVRIEKTNEPLGATVKNEDDAVVVGRIIRGGTAEASGLLHEGAEILEVNEVPLRGKNVNEVCDTLAQMQGTLTLLVVPSRRHFPNSSISGGEHSSMLHNNSNTSSSNNTSSNVVANSSSSAGPVMHVKAHIDYDPDEDPYLPCRELGISFGKGDILHVINQKDPHWWQARREGEDDLQLPGLIPSASFQQQREAVKHTIIQDSQKGGTSEKNGGLGKNHSTGFLCAKKSGRKNKRRKVPYLPEDEVDAEELITYEEVALYYPRSERKRPVVLIGPPNIGRHELRQRLMGDQTRFAAAIPHTSRTKRTDEVDGQDYHFISRPQFEHDILCRKFVEHGEYEKSYYGTSLQAIRSVVHGEKICVLNLHPQSLRILKKSDLMPFVVFVAPPSLEKLRRWKQERSEPINDGELREIIERAREMEEAYGHYFDMVIIYSEPERAYQELLREINGLEREPQWVPASWLQQQANNFYATGQ